MPRKATLVADALDCGVEPFTALISPVRRCLSREVYAFRTVRQINSLQLGVLLPTQYRNVCDRTQQSVRLAKNDLRAAIRFTKKLDEDGIEYNWISTYIPLKLALKTNTAEIAEEILKAEGFQSPSKICLEISSDALYEDTDKIESALKDFKLLGFTTAITAFGDDFCPINRLYGLPFDICMFDASVAEKAESSAGLRSVSHMTAFVKSNESDPVICVAGRKSKSANTIRPVKPDIYSQAG
ncbi:MAG: EAL domain-containing protein, partial [Eubacteriales bacterium]|nr:EAL domain-containing protein [Eubacteriales bacterium]